MPRPPIVPSDGVTPIVLGVSDDSVDGVKPPPAIPVDEPLRLVPERARDVVLRDVLPVERDPPERDDARPPRLPSVFAARVTRDDDVRRVLLPAAPVRRVLLLLLLEVARAPVRPEELRRDPPLERDDDERRVPVEREPVEREPVEREPVEREPVEREPVEREPVDREPVDRELVERRVPVEREPVEVLRRVPVLRDDVERPVPPERVPELRRVPVERELVLRDDVDRPEVPVDFRAVARPPRVPSVFAARVTRELELRRVVPPLRDDDDVVRRVPVLRDEVLRPPVERELVERRVPVERVPVLRDDVLRPPVERRVPVERVPVERVPVERVPVERVPLERVPVLRRVPVERVPLERVPVERVPVERVPVLRRVPVERVELVRRVPVERERDVVLRPLDDRPVEPLLERLLELDLLRAVAMCLLLVGEFGGNTSWRSMRVAPAVIQQEIHLSYFEMSSTTSPVCCSDARLATSA